MNMPRVVIGGTHSGVGKTTLATGIMAALKNQGLRVQGFKVGPDYIDPGYHRLATGTMSRNLDCWMLGEDRLLQSFTGAAESADISVVEGVMGLFDGAREDGAGSTAHVARLLQAPVILVVDVKSMGQSAAAVVYGYQHLWPDLNIKGVIINKVASEKHYAMVRESIEKKCNIPVIGAVYRDAALATPERHLGLLPVAEHDEVDEKISRLGENIAAAVDLAELITIARSAPSLTSPYRQKILNNFEVSLAVARDEAFNFYYQDGLDLLTAMGAKLKFFSPVRDKAIPENVDGIIIGGGFPETHLDELARNRQMLESLNAAHHLGMPIYAECGGLMFLTERVKDHDGRIYELAGLVPGTCVMGKRLVGMGYIKAQALTDNILCLKGQELQGHEFHYSEYHGSLHKPAFAFSGGRGANGRFDGFTHNNLLASYLHLNFLGVPDAARSFLTACQQFGRREGNG